VACHCRQDHIRRSKHQGICGVDRKGDSIACLALSIMATMWFLAYSITRSIHICIQTACILPHRSGQASCSRVDTAVDQIHLLAESQSPLAGCTLRRAKVEWSIELMSTYLNLYHSKPLVYLGGSTYLLHTIFNHLRAAVSPSIPKH